ncbi:TylF/MycF/NovP-related O-methyltransferase [Sporichthya sp.]|uniref:TylF/MycF/NovP-related O-methyltransferase n=1 Tax=Sporichthya sp. TaxID=65475 RepID=UPI00179E0312|nr:TylF/MycF/NovP-related O-methyltransferase [Sporichthya sp.]MBA3743433.1 class I SAM-dependent methyltransferase [Sporichthya sp.]
MSDSRVLSTATPRDLYLDLMARVLTRTGFEGSGSGGLVNVSKHSYAAYLRDLLFDSLAPAQVALVQALPADPEDRAEGRGWPSADAETMIGLRRLANIRECVEAVITEGTPGDLVETGVWRGGATIYMRAILAAHGVTDRQIWACDSFEGLPPPSEEHFPHDAGDVLYTAEALAVTVEQVKDNFRRYDLLDDKVTFVKGWFEETIPSAPIEQIAVLRLDGDMYSSTIVVLENLYDKVTPGGFVILDDYVEIAACRQATEDFRAKREITDPVKAIDRSGAFWRKS